MTPTLEQQQILDYNLEPGTVLKALAYAGTGKTSTNIMLAQKYYNGTNVLDCLYLAFNRSVVVEASDRFPFNTTVSTGHGLAYSHCGKGYEIQNLFYWDVAKLLGLSRYEASIATLSLETYLNSRDNEILPEHIQEDTLNKLSPDYVHGMCIMVSNLWRKMQDGQLPMTHSGYVKLFQLKNPTLDYDVIFLDEAQDTNPVMFKIIEQQLEKGMRVYVVGDPHQQIYSWRGAINAMDFLEGPTLRLSQSFRFGQNIAGFATNLLGILGETVPLVGRGPADEVSSQIPGVYTFLARTNGTIVRQAYHLASQGRKIEVVGDAFSKALDTMMQIHYLFAGKKSLITEKRFKFFRSGGDLKEAAQETFDIELLSKIQVVEDYGSSWPEVVDTIQDALSLHDPDRIKLSTVHKAKGLEWDNVVLGEDFESPLCQKDGELVLKEVTAVPPDDTDYRIHKEELNLLYVAGTRAKKHLNPGPLISLQQFFANKQNGVGALP